MSQRADNRPGEREEEDIPSLNVFSSGTDGANWRWSSIAPLLHGQERQHRSSYELALNGSDHFHRVYGSGDESADFRKSAGERFAFVTNTTRYSENARDGSETMQQNSSENSGSETTAFAESSPENPLPPLQSWSLQRLTRRPHSFGCTSDLVRRPVRRKMWKSAGDLVSGTESACTATREGE